MRKAVIVFLSLALLAAVSGTYAYAQAPPGLPHAFYGTVKINDSPALDGTEVSAIVDTGSIIAVQNPVTTVGGSYGITSPRLLVQGDIPNGATITFYVTDENGTAIGGTATFVAGGGPDEKNLSVDIAVPPTPSPPAGGGVGGVPTYYTDTNLFGTEARFRISSDGEILQTIEVTSEDGMLTITIPKGTIALGEDGKRLRSLQTAIDESPPSPPEGAHLIGLAYDFGPDGATFDPPITFIWSYDPDDIPEGVAEEDLVIAYYDGAEWVELDCVVDTENNTITASVEHFTTFAIIGAVAPEIPALKQDIDALRAEIASLQDDIAAAEAQVASLQEDVDAAEAKVASLQDDLAAAEAKVASLQSEFSTAQARLAAAQDELARLEAARGPNWGVIGGIIAGVVVIVGVLGYFLWWRRRAA